MSTVPARDLVAVQPSVLSAGGSALLMLGLLLTDSTRIPIGTVGAFASADDVGDYFGPSSTEKTLADIYFLGFDNSTKKPGSILFAQYNGSAVAGYLRGGSLGLTLTQLKAVTPGTLTITFGGVGNTSASIDLSGATSFSNAATIIEAAFTTPAFSVSYDSILDAFVFTSDATGAAATIVFPSDTIATALKLTSATGAVLSQGADAAVPGTFMDALIDVNDNWALFSTTFNPDSSGNDNKLAFASWTNSENNQYGYVPWDTDVGPTTSLPDTDSLGYLVSNTNAYSGTCVVWASDATEGAKKAAFVLGACASIDFTRREGRITFFGKHQSGLTADVTNQTVAHNLAGDPQAIGDWGNYYNFYGVYATRAEDFLLFNRGTVSGDFTWLDDYINQIYLNNALQQALMVLLTTVNSIPYNTAGYALIEASCLDPINAALLSGIIRAGIPLSAQQSANVDNAAGKKISDTIQDRGWYLQVSAASAQVRAARASPPCTLWYTSGQSVHAINLASILIQ